MSTRPSKYKPTFKRIALAILIAALLLVIVNSLVGFFLSRNAAIPPDILAGNGSQGVVKFWQLTDAQISPLVFTGSSQMKMALIPSQFDAQVKTLSGVATVSVNVSMIGADTKISQQLIENFLVPKGVHTIIYGIEMRSLNPLAAFNEELFTDTPFGYALTRPGPVERSVSLWLLQHVALIEYRNNLRSWLSGDLSVPSGTYQVDEDGYWNVPKVYARDSEIIKQQFAPFQTTDDLQASLNSILSACQQPEMRCIVINMPIHQDAYQVISDHDEAMYREILDKATTQAHIPLWDFNTKECRSYFNDADFFDLIHLNNSGAQKFTVALADFYVQQVIGKDTVLHTDCVAKS